jgi:ribosomal protein S18 acetylase RimI-like enzyme
MTEARVRVAPVTVDDIGRLQTLAGEIWRRHYAGMISAAQIEYMLAQRYGGAVLRDELERASIWWDKLLVDAALAGYASYFVTANPGEMKLDKLYVHHDWQRRGYGAMLLDRVLAVASAYGARTLTLTVNKANRAALAAYEKYGFRIVDAVVKDIGGGFVMDDYVMSRDV